MSRFGDHERFRKYFFCLLQLDILRHFSILDSKDFKRFPFQSFQVSHNFNRPYLLDNSGSVTHTSFRKRNQRNMRVQGRKSIVFSEIHLGTDRMRDMHLFDVLF